MNLPRVFLVPCILVALGCLPAAAQPVIYGVANAASFAVSGLPNAGIAQGSMFVIFGSGLGPANLTQVSSYPLPSSQGLAGTTVNINTVSFAGQADAIMIYTSANQVAAIVPSSLNYNGNVVVTVTYNGQTSNTAFMRLTNSQFGSFTLNQSGSGAAVAQNYNSATDEPYNGLTAPAKPGQLVILWGTGLGPISGAEDQGPRPGQLNLNLQVYVGGQQAQLSYYGRSGCCSGIDQVVFAVPPGIAGCSVPVAVVINGISSNTATIAVSPDGGACSDPLGVSSSDIQNGAVSGTTRFANISLNHTDGGNPADSGSATFSSTPFVNFADAQGIPAPGSCIVISGSGNATSPPSPATPLDAGPSLQVAGPATGTLTKNTNGGYSGVLSPLQAGDYTVSGTGGTDVGPFSASLTVPPPLTWTNQTALTSITPGVPFTVNWTAGDPNSYVAIEGLAANTSTNLFAIFACVEHAAAGAFTVPGYITASLPAGVGGVGVNQNGVPSRFGAPGIDAGYFAYSAGSIAAPVTVGSAGGGGKK